MLEKEIPSTVAQDASFLRRTESRDTELAETIEQQPQIEKAE